MQATSERANEIVDAILQALDSLDWVVWAKSQMEGSTSPAAIATAPAPDVFAPPPAPPERDLYSAVIEREHYVARANALARAPEIRDLAFRLCERAALQGHSPDYAGTVQNVAAGKREVALVA